MMQTETYFPDDRFESDAIKRALILIAPLLYLFTTLLYSAYQAVWGGQVDPESAYTMNGLVAAAGYGSMKFDHPGTTTTLLVEVIVRVWALFSRSSDIVTFGLQNFDSITYTARICQALILAAALLSGGLIVTRATNSAIAGMLFQVGPFIHADTFHFEMVLIPESLMVSVAIFGMALVIKAALGRNEPSVGLGVLSGLVFALGFSTKYLYFPIAMLSVCLLRNTRAFVAAMVVGALGFTVLNLTFNPGAITRGFGWLFSIATHKGIYGHGEPGFADLGSFRSNMREIVTAAPVVCAIYFIGAVGAIAYCVKCRSWRDPVSLTLIAAFSVFVAQLVATSKHFALHYMMASWVLTGGVLVIVVIQVRRLVPSIPPYLMTLIAGSVCAFITTQSLASIRRDALAAMALDAVGARLSRAVIKVAPACANVSGMFVRAPENDLNHGWDMTMESWGDQSMKDRFSLAYDKSFEARLLDHNAYMGVLKNNFRRYTYLQLSKDYPCIIVRSQLELSVANSAGLLELNPEHCVIEGVHVYTLGFACSNVRNSFNEMTRSQHE